MAARLPCAGDPGEEDAGHLRRARRAGQFPLAGTKGTPKREAVRARGLLACNVRVTPELLLGCLPAGICTVRADCGGQCVCHAGGEEVFLR